MKQTVPNTLLICLMCIVLLIGVWLLGKRQGAQETLAVVAGQISSAEAQSMIDKLQFSLHDKEQEVVVLSQDLRAREARAQALLEQLDEQMRENMSSASELALYRKIETSEKPRGIEVESIIWRASQPATLEVVLIQWQGRDRIVGEVSVSLGYHSATEPDASTLDAESDSTLEITDTNTVDGGAVLSAPSGNLRLDNEALSFDFRFFQTLNISMPLPISDSETENYHLPVPDYVEVVLTASDKRVKTVKTQIPWKDISE